MLHCIQDAENNVQKCWPGILSTWNCWIYRSHNHSGNACNNEGTCEYPTGHSVPLSVELVKCVPLVATQTAGQTHASWRYALRGACITRIQSLPVHIALRNKPHIVSLYMATNYALDILPYYPFLISHTVALQMHTIWEGRTLFWRSMVHVSTFGYVHCVSSESPSTALAVSSKCWSSSSTSCRDTTPSVSPSDITAAKTREGVSW